MLPYVYKAFTTYEGMYIGYLIPIVYFSRVTFTTAFNNFKRRRHAGLNDVIAAIAMILIAADFINYLYLFFSRTGALLPPSLLYGKYVVGFCLWIWALAYCYRAYFSRTAAGSNFRQRLILFAIVIVASLILSGLGIALLPAHAAVAV